MKREWAHERDGNCESNLSILYLERNNMNKSNMTNHFYHTYCGKYTIKVTSKYEELW